MPLRLVSKGTPRTILLGPSAGLRWYPAAGSHAIWLGLYERAVLDAFARAVRPGFVVWDVGAHAGLYALVAARTNATVHAFEPLPDNVEWLRRHLTANRLERRVYIEPYALGRTTGESYFKSDGSRMEGRLSATGDLVARVYAADQLNLIRPDIIKIDVEGAELDVLAGAAEVIRSRRPVCFVEVHDPISIHDCLRQLPGYTHRQLDGPRFLCTPAS